MFMEPNRNRITNPLKQYAKYTGIAFQMMAIMAFSTWLGLKTDELFDLQFPLFTLIFIITALGLLLYKIIRSISN